MRTAKPRSKRRPRFYVFHGIGDAVLGVSQQRGGLLGLIRCAKPRKALVGHLLHLSLRIDDADRPFWRERREDVGDEFEVAVDLAELGRHGGADLARGSHHADLGDFQFAHRPPLDQDGGRFHDTAAGELAFGPHVLPVEILF